VVHHQRRPFPDHHSVERMFDAVRQHLPAHLDPVVAIAPATSKGLVPRVRTAVAARRHRGDVHHVTGDVTYLGLLLPRRRTVLTILDCEFLDRAGWAKGLVYRVFWLQLPCLRAAVVTALSPATADHLRRAVWIAPRDLRVVPALLPDGFDPAPPAANETPTVLQVGTRPNKGLAEVARALAGTGWRLLTIGVLEEDQRALLRQHGVDHEERSGLDQPGLATAYRDADVLAFASTREGFGIPVLEAQASGRPVVTSDREPLPWVAGPGGAVLVDPTDPDSIRAGLASVLEDPSRRAALVAAGLANVDRFRAERVAAQYAAIYDELAARR
jgi:glycosyltransferase involved in cell wall biosynthesis